MTLTFRPKPLFLLHYVACFHSGRPLAGFALPERLVAAALDRAPQGQDGIRSGDAPVHARFFEAAPDDRLATRLDDAT